MKKLLSLLTALTFTSFSTLGVVACSHNSQLQKTDISKKIPNSINLEKLDTNTTTDFVAKLVIQLNKVSELKNIASTDFDIYKAGTTTSIQDSDIFPNSSLKIKIVVKKSSTKFSGSKDNIVVIYKNEQQDTIYIDKDDKKQTTNAQDLSDLNITEVTQIGYYTNDKGEIQAVRMPTTILKVPNQLPPQITSTSKMFARASSFNQDLSSWDTSNVTNMSDMFHLAINFNGNISNWDTSKVINMSGMFFDTEEFNQDLLKWKTSNVTNMSDMFHLAINFNGNISNWDTSNVTNMSGMFTGTQKFNQNLLNSNTSWDTSNVTNMSYMFAHALSFNGDIRNWKTSNVTNMEAMFFETTIFNNDITKWKTSNVTNMNIMFAAALKFNQNISTWDVFHVITYKNFNQDSALSNSNLPKFKNSF